MFLHEQNLTSDIQTIKKRDYVDQNLVLFIGLGCAIEHMQHLTATYNTHSDFERLSTRYRSVCLADAIEERLCTWLEESPIEYIKLKPGP